MPELTASGKWIADISIPDISLEIAEKRLEGGDKKHFLRFMRKMLRWKPEDRYDSRTLWYDFWLLVDILPELIESGQVVLEEK